MFRVFRNELTEIGSGNVPGAPALLGKASIFSLTGLQSAFEDEPGDALDINAEYFCGLIGL